MFRPYFTLLALTALALFLYAGHGHAKSATKKRPRPPVVQAAMGFQTPQVPGAACRKTYEACLASCPGGDTCSMECETDCSICTLEETGDIDVDTKNCRR